MTTRTSIINKKGTTSCFDSEEESPIIESKFGSFNRAAADGENHGPARLDLLEHENANLRQLLSSVCQILCEMRRTAQLHLMGKESDQVTEPADLSSQIGSLPITWVYDQIKTEIEQSLATINEYLCATQVE